LCSIKNIDFDSDIQRNLYRTSHNRKVIGHILEYQVLCPGSEIGFYSGNPINVSNDQE
jgi:hypothetical protein